MADKYTFTVDVETLAAIKKLQDLGDEAKGVVNEQKKAAKASGDAWSSFKGTLAALGVEELFRRMGAAAIDAFKASVGAAVELESKLGRIQTLLGQGEDAQKLFLQEILKLQSTFGTSQSDAAAAFYEVLSSGATDAAGSVELLNVANKLAIGGVTSLETAADGLTSILSAYGFQAERSAQISDVLFIGAKVGKTTIEELSNSIGNVAPLANNMNVSIEELVSSIAAITTAGVPTAEAVTQVRSAMAGLATQTDVMKEVLKSLGITSIQAAIQQNGLVETLKMVAGATDGSAESLNALFGRVEAVNAVVSLTSNSIGGKFQQSLNDMKNTSKNAGAVTEQAFGAVAKTSEQQLNVALGKVAATATGLGFVLKDSLYPATVSVIEGLNELAFIPLVDFIKENTEGIKAFSIALTAGVAAAGAMAVAANSTAIAMGALAAAQAALTASSAAMSLLLGPIGVAFVAVGGAAYLVASNYDALIANSKILYAVTIEVADALWLSTEAMNESAKQARAEAEEIYAQIQAKEDKKLIEEAVAQAAVDSAQKQIAASQTVTAAAQQDSTARIGLSLAELEAKKKAKQDELKAESEFVKKLSDLKAEQRAQEEELRLLQAEESVVNNDARLQSLIDQLGREEGIKAEARLRALEGEKQTTENLREQELLKGEIRKATLERQIEDERRKDEGLLTLQQEYDLKVAERNKKKAEDEKKALAERRKNEEDNLVFFKDQKDAELDFEKKTASQKLDVVRNGFSTFAQLSKSGNKQLGEIGKAAAIAGATIDTYRAANSAYAALAGIPVVGPELGAAAAAAAVVAGLANIRQIQSARYERGGIIPGSSFTGDTVTARVNSGELILNRAQQKNLAPQLMGQDNSDVVSAIRDLQVDVRNLQLTIGDEDVFNAVNRQVQAGRQL